MAFVREAIEKSMTRRIVEIGARALRSRAHSREGDLAFYLIRSECCGWTTRGVFVMGGMRWRTGE